MRASATAVLRTIIASAQLSDEPTARNSKRLPVKANGDVRLRSVLSSNKDGICVKPPIRNTFFESKRMSVPPSDSSILSSTSEICVPRKVEIMVGGASPAPKRCSFEALITEAFSRPLWRCTAAITFTKKVINCKFSKAVRPGFKRFTPVSVPSDQLLCLPEPFMPLNGFSCRSTRKWWRVATLPIMVIRSWLWSFARFASS